MNDFLPNNYEVPQKAGSYMKFQDGANRIRILTSAIIGWQYWVEDEKGVRRPVRKTMDEDLVMSEIPEPEQVKHFWAFVVWNYQEEKVQILEVTQKGIQISLRALAKDEDWGSPLNYDIVITRTGKKLETKYSVQPKPAKEVDEKILKAYRGMEIDLNALFRGEDPFGKEEKVNPEEVQV